MGTHLQKLAAISVITAVLTACGSSNNSNNVSPQDARSSVISTIADLNIACASVQLAEQGSGVNGVSLSLVSTYVSGNDFDTSSAEIVSYDQCTDKLYVVNAKDKSVDILNIPQDGTAPTKAATLDLAAAGKAAGIAIGAANSVVAKNGVIAVAIENSDKQADGIVALYRADTRELLATYKAGALPDMVTMTDNSQYILAANEGEPSGDYTNDPEGSVTIVNLQAGLSADKALVTQVRFTDFNDGQAKAGQRNGARLTRPHGASVAQDLEPEYIAITSANKAVVALQENNAFAVIDIASAVVESINGLGKKSWASVADGGEGSQLDLTNKDDVFSLASYPQLVGYYQPDTIAAYSVNGRDYIISANEGDGREYVYAATQQACENASHTWGGDDNAGQPAYSTLIDDCISHTDETRASKLTVDASHPLMNAASYPSGTIADKNAIGRIKVIADEMSVGPNDDVITFGARSFSIWDANAQRVYDSGSELSENANTVTHWNASNDAHENDNRSDDKGVEPEAIEVAEINGQHIAFIGLERHGGVAVYNVSNPANATFLSYLNNRDFSQDVCTVVDGDGECDNATYNPSAGDLGPESIDYFSRLGKHFIAVGNEVSGTTSIYEMVLN